MGAAHPSKRVPDLELTAPIAVGDDVYIGVNAVILPGVTIGNRCIIGAGAVVTKSIPGNSVAVGVPAKVVKLSMSTSRVPGLARSISEIFRDLKRKLLSETCLPAKTADTDWRIRTSR